MFSSLSAHFTAREMCIHAALLVLLAVAWFFHRGILSNPDGSLAAFERAAVRFAEKKNMAILVMALAPIVLRVSLLWLMPVPVPAIHDEFSYLLAADTFAHGRLTNPPHPMWVFFETIHVNMYPTYMSKYPPAQGAVLALGQVLGYPWIGVLLSVSAMCASVTWMLQAWFPSRWALLGATLLLLRLGTFSYWMNSYWGGAVAATGGALVMGALPRIFRRERPRARDALLLGLGGAVLANARPFEGLVLFVTVTAAMILWLFGSPFRGPSAILAWEKISWCRRILGSWLCSKPRPAWRVILPRVVLPLAAILVATVSFIAYYNWRVTANIFLPPYIANDHAYNTTPTFVWQKALPARHYLNAQFDSYYNTWARPFWARNTFSGYRNIVSHSAAVVLKAAYFYLCPELCVPLLALPWMIGDGRVRFLSIVGLWSLLGLLSVVWSEPHYAAPITAVILALVVQGIRHLRCWKFRGRQVGIALSRALVVFSAALLLVYAAEALRNPYSGSYVEPAGVWSSP